MNATVPAPRAATRREHSPLHTAVEAWLDELRKGRRLSARTVDAYRRDLADYHAFARTHRLARWDEATVTFVDGYFASLQRRGLSGATVARRRSTLRGFHAFLARVGLGLGLGRKGFRTGGRRGGTCQHRSGGCGRSRR